MGAFTKQFFTTRTATIITTTVAQSISPFGSIEAIYGGKTCIAFPHIDFTVSSTIFEHLFRSFRVRGTRLYMCDVSWLCRVLLLFAFVFSSSFFSTAHDALNVRMFLKCIVLVMFCNLLYYLFDFKMAKAGIG